MSKPFVLVVLATNTEESACEALLSNWMRRFTAWGTDGSVVEFPECFALFQRLEAMGNLDAAATVQEFIHRYHPALVLGVGICAAPPIGSRTRPYCTLMVGTEIVYYEPAKQLPNEEDWRPRLFRSTLPEALIDRMRAPNVDVIARLMPRGQSVEAPQLVRGLFAAGERVLADEKEADRLRHRILDYYDLKLEAIDMESAGIARACKAASTPFAIVKGVSDHATVSKSDAWQMPAATVAIAATVQWLGSLTDADIRQLIQCRKVEPQEDDLSRAESVSTVAGTMLPVRGVARRYVQDQATDDLVTLWDKEIQRFLEDTLPLSGDRFHGEEALAAAPEGFDLRSGRVWVVDPVDGTQNLVAGRPEIAISIALLKEGEPDLGVVCLPMRGLTISCCGERPLQVNGMEWFQQKRRPRRIEDAIVGLPGDLRRLRGTGVERLVNNLVDRAAGLRITGALAYDLACLSLGEIDARLSTSAKLHDVAAGVQLVRSIGGRVTDLHGAEWTLESTTLLAAATVDLHRELLEALSAGASSE